jgi:hypothetical protein
MIYALGITSVVSIIIAMGVMFTFILIPFIAITSIPVTIYGVYHILQYREKNHGQNRYINNPGSHPRR